MAALAAGGLATAERAEAAGSCTLPGVKTFTGAPGSSWFNNSNWTPAGQPNGSTHVCIPNGVSIGTGATATAASVEASGPVNVSAGALNVTSTTQQSDIHGTLTLSGSGLLGGAGTMSVDGTLNWTATSGGLGDGLSTGTTLIAPTGTLAISGAGQRLLNARQTLRVEGTATWNGANDILTHDRSRIVVASGGVFDAKNNQTIIDNYCCTAANEPRLDVLAGGTLTKSAGAGTTTIGVAVDNDGTTSSSFGTLSLGTGSALPHRGSGELTASSGGVVAINGTYQPELGATVDGSGVALATGTIGGTGTLTVEGRLDWTSNSGGLGDATNAGTTVISPSGTLVINGGTAERYLRDKYTLRIEGDVNWNGPNDIFAGRLAKIEIASGGTLDATSNQTIFNNYCCTLADYPRLNVLAGGTLTKSAGNGTTTIAVAVDNDGTTSSSFGTLSLGTGSALPHRGSGELTASSGGILAINGTFQPDPGATVDGTGVALAGGTIGGTGTLTVEGALDWTSSSGGLGDGTNAGTTVIGPSGTLVINGGTAERYLRDKYTLRIEGDVNWTGPNDIYTHAKSKIEIASGGTLDAQSNQTLFDNYCCTPADEPRMNVLAGGTLTKSAGAGTTTIGLELDNDGTTSASAGTLSLVGGSGASASNGAFTAGSGAVVDFGGGTHLLGPDPTFDGGGTVRISAGQLNVPGTTTMAADSTLSLAGGTLGGAGTLTVDGTLNWTSSSGGLGDATNAGTTVIGPSGTLVIDGTAERYLRDKYTLRIEGDANWIGPNDIYTHAKSKIEIASGGTLDAQSNQTLIDNYCCTPADEPRLDVLAGGTLTKSAGAGTTAIAVTVDNDGTTSASIGTLSLNPSDLPHRGSGELSASSGGIVAINGTFQPELGATVDGNGVALTGGTIGGTETLTVEGRLDWTSSSGGLGDGTNAGTTLIGPTGTLVINGTAERYLRDKYTLRIEGSANWSGPNDIFTTDRSKIVVASGGILDAQSNQTIIDNYCCTPANEPRLDVLAGGTLRKSAGGGTSTIALLIGNQGTISAENGKLDLGANLENHNAGTRTLTGGAYAASNNGRLAITSLDLLTNAASIRLAGGGLLVDQLNVNGVRNLATNAAGSRLELAAGRNLTLPTFTNNGTVALAQNTTLTTANYTQTASGRFVPTVSGTVPGTSAGHLVSNGTAALDGTLDIDSTTVPPPGASVDIINSTGARTGTFSTVIGGPGYNVDYKPNAVTLVSNALPTISIGDAAVVEGDAGTQTTDLNVTLSSPSTQTVTVRVRTTDGSATAPADYQSFPNQTITFVPGDTSEPISSTGQNITVNGDTINEGDESFNLSLSNATNATISDPAGQVRILDEEGPLSLYVRDTVVTEGNAGTTEATFDITLSDPLAPGQTVSANYQTANAKATTANNDYVAESGTVTFTDATPLTQTVDVTVNGDTTKEANEAFKLNLSAPSGAALGDNSGQATIVNDDVVAPVAVKPSVYVDDVDVFETDAGTQAATFTVELSEPAATQATVNYKTEATTAVAPDDYTELPTTPLIFAPGDTSETVTVDVQGDTVRELTETFKLKLPSASSNVFIADSLATGTILDDEGPISVHVADVRVVEGDSGTRNAVIVVQASETPAAGQSVVVSFQTTGGSATAGVDYTATSGQVELNAANPTRNINVPILGDTAPEPDETFNVALSAPKRGALGDASSTVTIRNDD